MPTSRDLILVTAGLGLDGGGRAVVGRLLARAGAEWAAAAGAGFRVLDLGDGAPEPLATELRERGASVWTAGGSRLRLAWAAWRAQGSAAASRRPALLFDLLGLARLQVVVPSMLRAPYAVWVHGIEVWRPLALLERRALRGSDQVLASSAATLARGEPFLPPGLAASPLHPVLEGWPSAAGNAPLPADSAGSPELPEGIGRGFVLIVGRMAASERYKGHDELLEALPALARTVPHARLVIAGGGDDRRRLEAKAEALGVAGRTCFTGFVGEAALAELYRRAAVFAMPSRGEGFGLVYLEAMRAGVPVVALDGTAAAEIVVPGETGVLVPPDDRARLPGELARALAGLLNDPERARALGAAGRERWQRCFSPERFRASLSHHLDALTGRTRTA